ncbi:MAG TPA: EamA family transporter [Candidatus Nitrosotenuis sp.]|nr:EamA family transporter [Candidatus Nitrosotenuis sp.]
MRTAFFLFVVIVAGTLGEICITQAMKRIGEVHEFSPRAILGVMRRAFTIGKMWLGFALMAVSFFAMLELLSREDVSFIIPASAGSYVAGAFAAEFFLREHISRRRWLGVLLVSAGVALVWAGK